MLTKEQLIELDNKRFRYLQTLYDLSSGDEHKTFNIYDIGEKAGISDHDEIDRIVQYLTKEDLIEGMYMDGHGGAYAIQHRGVVEIEQAISDPSQRTQHFGPLNIILQNVTMHNSQIMGGSPGATQTQTISQSYNDLAKEIKSLKNDLDKLVTDDPNKTAAKHLLDMVEDEANTETPDKNHMSKLMDKSGKIMNLISGGADLYIKLKSLQTQYGLNLPI